LEVAEILKISAYQNAGRYQNSKWSIIHRKGRTKWVHLWSGML